MELYRTDGTVEGTAIVADVGPGRQHGLLYQGGYVRPSALAALGDDAVIFAGTDSRGTELWRADNAGALIGDAGATYTVVEGQTVALSAAGSRAGTSPIVSYEWDFDFDGTFVADASGVNATFTGVDGPTTKTVAVRVTDAAGNTHVDTVRVSVTNVAPEASINGAATADEGVPYTLDLSWHDDGDDTVRHWTIAWGDGTVEIVQGNFDSVSHIYPDGPARHRISASVTDEDGTFEMRRLLVGLRDGTFGNGGIAVGPVAASEAMALQSDGKIVTVGGSDDFVVARWNADGTPDASFGTGGGGVVTTDFVGASEAAHAVVVQADGRVVVAGTASGAAADWVLARYMPDGTLDASFGVGGKVTLDVGVGPLTELRDVFLRQDGRIVLAGSVESGAGDVDFAVARLDTDGRLDAGFGSGGITVTNFGGQDRAYAVALQPDGRIVLAGDGAGRFALARYTADGAADSTFGTDGKSNPFIDVFQPQARDVAIAPDGKIVVAGTAFNRLTVLRYRSDGALDRTFGRQGMTDTTTYEGATSVVVGPDGRIVATGGGGQGGAVLARFNPNGVRDETFGGQGMGFVDVYAEIGDLAGLAVLVQPDGHVLVLASMRDGGAMLARFNAEEPATGVQVRDVPPTILLPEQAVVGAWTDWTLAVTFADPGNDTWTAAVRYGDGPAQALPLNQKAFTLGQTWREPGNYPVVVVLTDEDGVTSSRTMNVIVRGPTLRGTVGDDVFRLRMDGTGKTVQFFENVADGAPPTFVIPADRVGAVSVEGGAGDDLLVIEGGTFTFPADLGLTTSNLRLRINAAEAVFGSGQQLAGVTLGPAGRARIVPGGPHVVAAANFAVADDATFDVGDGELIVAVEGTDVVALRALVARGRGDGHWTGMGITSSVAASSARGMMGLAMSEGVGTVRIRYAYNGDANVDGRINSDDYFRIDNGFLEQPAMPLYSDGDFNYDDRINADDYFLIDQAFLGQGTPLMGAPPAAGALVVSSSVAAEPQQKAVRKRPVRSIFSDEPVTILGPSRRTDVARRR